MRKATIGAIAFLALSGTLCPQEKSPEKPPPVSKKLGKLPPPPKFAAQQTATLPPPPSDHSPSPPPPAPARRFEVALPAIGPTLGGGYQDFQLPPGELSVSWVAVGPGNSDVSSGIDVTVLSSQLYCKPSPSGALRLVILQPGANVRVWAQRKGFAGAFQVRVSFEVRNAS